MTTPTTRGNQIVTAGSGESYQYDAAAGRQNLRERGSAITFTMMPQARSSRTGPRRQPPRNSSGASAMSTTSWSAMTITAAAGIWARAAAAWAAGSTPQQDVNWDVVVQWSIRAETLSSRVDYSPYAYAAIVVNSSYTAPLGTLFTGNGTSFIYWEYGFQGGRAEVGGLFRFGLRDYDTNRQQWVQQDPTGYLDGSNLYSSFGDNPVSRVDPFGLFEVDGPVDGLFWFFSGGGNGAWFGQDELSELNQSSSFQQYLYNAEQQALASARGKFHCADTPFPGLHYRSNGWTVTPTDLNMFDYDFDLLGHNVEYSWDMTVTFTNTKMVGCCCVADVIFNWTVNVRKLYIFSGKGYYGYGFLKQVVGTSYWLGGQISGTGSSRIGKCD